MTTATVAHVPNFSVGTPQKRVPGRPKRVGRGSRPPPGAAWPRRLRPLVGVGAVALALGVLVVAGALTRGVSGDAGLPPDVGVVVAVVDGDTIDIRIAGRDERVRLIGIDTPETHVDEGPPECYGPEASAHLAGLLPIGSQVRLTRDVVGRDDYGRLLAYVHRRDDGRFVNAALAAGGFARPLTIAPNDAYARRFVDLATAAEAADRGLWEACRG